MTDTLDAVVEIFTWVGFGVGAFFAGVAVIAYLFDGTWIPVRAVVEHLADATVVRWFDEDGEVNEAPLSEHQIAEISTKDMADVWARRGYRDRMRLHRRSPIVKGLTLISGVFLGVGVLALIVSTILLFVR